MATVFSQCTGKAVLSITQYLPSPDLLIDTSQELILLLLLFTVGTGSFPGVKRPGNGADHPPLSKRRGHERVELYLYSPSGPQWPVIGRTIVMNMAVFIETFENLTAVR